MGIGSVLRSPYDWITQNFFRARTTQVKKRNTGCQEMAEACPAEITRDKILARYQGMALRIVLNADSRLLNQFFFCLKHLWRKGVIFDDDFRRKTWLFGLCCPTNENIKLVGNCEMQLVFMLS